MSADDRLLDLLEAHLEGRLSSAEARELSARLRSSAEARRIFWQYAEQHAQIQDVLSETRGLDLGLAESGAPDDPPQSLPMAPRSRRRPLLWAAVLTAAVAAAVLLVVSLWPRRQDDPPPIPPTPPPAFATVKALEGDVLLSGTPVAAGATIAVGQTLRVEDDDGRAEIQFADGTQLTVGSGSTLHFAPPEGHEGKRLHLESGTVQVDATTQTDASQLVVTTEHANFIAQGSRFRLYREPRSSRVELERGNLRLERRVGDPVEVAEGSFAVAKDLAHPVALQPMPVAQSRLRHVMNSCGDAACFSPKGTELLLATSHVNLGLKVWGMDDGKVRSKALGNGQRTDDMVFRSANSVVVLGSKGTARLWGANDAPPSDFRLRDKNLRGGAASPDGRWLAQATGDEVAVWALDDKEQSFSVRCTLPIKASRVALSRSRGPLVAVSRRGGEILVHDVNTGKAVSQYKLNATPDSLALSPGAGYLAAYSGTDGLVLFDRKTGTQPGEGTKVLWRQGEGAKVNHLRFSADGDVLLAALADGTVRAWYCDGRPLLVLDTGHKQVNRVAASDDLSQLVTVSNDSVKVWDVTLRTPD